MLTPWPENVPYPTPDDIVFPKGITHGIVHDCERDPEYKFLHETAVGQCGGSIFVAWYNNYKAEMVYYLYRTAQTPQLRYQYCANQLLHQ